VVRCTLVLVLGCSGRALSWQQAVSGQARGRHSPHSSSQGASAPPIAAAVVWPLSVSNRPKLWPSGAGVSGAISLGGAPEAGSGPGAHPGGIAACRAERRDPGQRPCDERHCAGKERAARQALRREHGKVTELLQQCRHGHKLTAAAVGVREQRQISTSSRQQGLSCHSLADRDRDGLPIDRSPAVYTPCMSQYKRTKKRWREFRERCIWRRRFSCICRLTWPAHGCLQQ